MALFPQWLPKGDAGTGLMLLRILTVCGLSPSPDSRRLPLLPYPCVILAPLLALLWVFTYCISIVLYPVYLSAFFPFSALDRLLLLTSKINHLGWGFKCGVLPLSCDASLDQPWGHAVIITRFLHCSNYPFLHIWTVISIMWPAFALLRDCTVAGNSNNYQIPCGYNHWFRGREFFGRIRRGLENRIVSTSRPRRQDRHYN